MSIYKKHWVVSVIAWLLVCVVGPNQTIAAEVGPGDDLQIGDTLHFASSYIGHPIFCGDHQVVYMTEPENNRYELNLYNIESGETRQISGGGWPLTCSRDGKYLFVSYYTEFTSYNIRLWNLETGKKWEIGAGHFQFRWSPDGQYLFYYDTGAHAEIEIWPLVDNPRLELPTGMPFKAVTLKIPGVNIVRARWLAHTERGDLSHNTLIIQYFGPYEIGRGRMRHFMTAKVFDGGDNLLGEGSIDDNVHGSVQWNSQLLLMGIIDGDRMIVAEDLKGGGVDPIVWNCSTEVFIGNVQVPECHEMKGDYENMKSISDVVQGDNFGADVITYVLIHEQLRPCYWHTDEQGQAFYGCISGAENVFDISPTLNLALFATYERDATPSTKLFLTRIR